MGATAILLMLLVRGLKQEVPSQATTTGLGYPDSVKTAVATSEEAVTALAKRVDQLDTDQESQNEALRILADAIAELDERLHAGDPR